MVLKLIIKTVKTNLFARKAPEINKQIIFIGCTPFAAWMKERNYT